MTQRFAVMLALGAFLFACNVQADPPKSDSAEKKIEWCRLQHPGEITMKAKTKSEYVYGQVYIPNCSEGAKHCPGVIANACITPKGEKKYSCFPAKQNKEFRTDTNNDEYMVEVYAANPGEYALIYKFSLDDGLTWVECDFDDAAGFDIQKAGKVIVTE